MHHESIIADKATSKTGLEEVGCPQRLAKAIERQPS